MRRTRVLFIVCALAAGMVSIFQSNSAHAAVCTINNEDWGTEIMDDTPDDYPITGTSIYDQLLKKLNN